MTDFNIGDMLKVKGENFVFKIDHFASGLEFPDSEGWVTTIPKGWPVSPDGWSHNPDMCEMYTGAISVFERDEDNG